MLFPIIAHTTQAFDKMNFYDSANKVIPMFILAYV